MRAIFHRPASSAWRWNPARKRAPVPCIHTRSLSTLVSSTAINATKAIPSKNRSLYDALNDLKKKTSAQLDLSRLQLALQGLESDQPTTRIALLGADGTATARRLARLHLADPSEHDQAWEAELVAQNKQREQPLVIRYGDPEKTAFEPPRALLPVLRIPSSLLRSQKVEILIAPISTPSPNSVSHETASIPPDALLSPAARTPISANQRQSLINQPVHRTILVASRLDELLGISKLLSATQFGSEAERRLVDVVLDLKGEPGRSESHIITVDSTRTEKVLHNIREAVVGPSEYEKVWEESGMSAFAGLVASASATNASTLPTSVRDLITALLEGASATLASQNRESTLTDRSNVLSNLLQSSLENAIGAFSQQGHAELQSGLAVAFSSRNWRKLAFWKLFWRVDDVPLIVSDLVTAAWLPRTERAVYELSGRLKQAGVPLAADPAASSVVHTGLDLATDKNEKAVANVAQPTFALASSAPADDVPRQDLPSAEATAGIGPIPYTPPSTVSIISKTREKLITSAVTTLSSSAQQIVLRALTITGISAALSSLSYLSVTTGNLYESASVLALGTAYALRRMQQEWEVQCRDFEQELMNEGRSAIKETEEHIRGLVDDAARVDEDEVDVRMRREASEAIDKAKAALRELG